MIIPVSRRPPVPLELYEITAFRFSSSEPDYDGLVGSFKVIIDGLQEIGVLKDDKLSNTGPWRCFWFEAKPKAGFIRICIQERARDRYEGL